MARRKIPLRDRFDEQWALDSETGCWNWLRGTNKAGYGRISVDLRAQLAHRIAYQIYVGPIPDGLQLDHLCRNRKCVNPNHLEPVTSAINAKRGIAGVLSAARQLAKTHCKHGHPLSGENLMIAKGSGQRVCLACRLIRKQKYNARIPKKGPNLAGLRLGGAANGARLRAATHCKRGHPWDEPNTYYDKNGNRVCRACDRLRARKK